MDKNAKCVWIDGEKVNSYANFIEKFELPADFSGATLHIAAGSKYAAWLNGELAAFGQYSDWPERRVYDSVDVGALARTGENTLCVLGYWQGESASTYKKAAPGVIFSLECGGKTVAASGETTLAREARDYASGRMEKITSQLCFTFYCDGRERDGWELPGYDASGWGRAEIRGDAGELFPRPVKKTTLEPRAAATLCAQGVYKLPKPDAKPSENIQFAYLSHRSASALTDFKSPDSHAALPAPDGIRFRADDGDGFYAVLDLGREETGYIDIDIDAPAGTVIDIGFGEHLDDLRVRASVGGRNFAARYICREGRNSFANLLQRVGARYIELHVGSREAALYYAGLLPSHYPLEPRGSFSCSDSLHNRINDVSMRTLLLCMHEHYEDCPWREQSLYSMDSRIQMLCGYYCFGEYDFARESIRLLAQGLRADGQLELCAPAEVPVVIPSFSVVWVVDLWEYVLYSGDMAFGREMLPTARAVLANFESHACASGLVRRFGGSDEYWNFYEWQPGLDGSARVRQDEPDAPLNAYYSLALGAMSKLCGSLGEDASHYDSLRARVNAAFETFWREDAGAYSTFCDGTHFAELTQALAILCGACPENRRAALLSRLAEPDGMLVTATLNDRIHTFGALLTDPDKYSRLVFERISDEWGAMLCRGATSFWETQRGADDFGDAGSLCHGWAAVPIYFYYTCALGIRPTSPGWKTYEVTPLDCGVHAASGAAPTPKGSIEVSVSDCGKECKVKDAERFS